MCGFSGCVQFVILYVHLYVHTALCAVHATLMANKYLILYTLFSKVNVAIKPGYVKNMNKVKYINYSLYSLSTCVCV